MSDSIDRVFVKAITTIRALSSRSNHGSLPRPPAESRMKLYGLYKQATEGDVEGIMARPIGFTLEDEGAKKKWDAWKREQSLSKTEAKRRYISYLIDTMKVYASGTIEARELLSELEYLWDQIKDLEFSPEEELEHIPNIPFPTHSPSFSQADQSDRYSTGTPLPLPSNYSNPAKSNLHKIYSHSRRSTMLNINDYVQQQRQQQQQQSQHLNKRTTGSVYSLTHDPLAQSDRLGLSLQSLPNNPGNSNITPASMEDFKNWQGEINLIINKLSREFVNRRSRNFSPSESDLSDYSLDPRARMKRRLLHLLRIIGSNAFKVLKSFSISALTIMFIVWCFKKNVVVQRTIVRKPSANSSRETEELVINMILNTNENKWFIRMLSFLNSFVGFV
ncbi:hypothetical protein PSN45_003883 [Yamadazyma tenuis]|uniref:ACB domain-containing protein n=1 Tax=Candida tenuis (strain ATCC 10573 / BCRC 21748 / CBS 615 / JCM 9827 / NBRC 10315 / NRRL Y-1498 / VKM Y-70) TaxID=590646 RepID=G3B511_CANTC|nr:uncharacterized protein CANTEDRAFT_114069 [Yamadazyma tenuis ATCC 10573]XP_006686654.1 uncharacterized protein CANTEDRAFT_114069 [Yamadazyma tenuis ATCC 10573]EGV64339.1 hypothetical protein CANTEDRAFT_114069 [Yamadazyma tenuis ATCC 10573]EGV64340.1 hypothetical protein CANTEDRAFT_114069 [Yamadazyma tenuis ATCC 10573]WEJ96344.1 hypothetical protein PSN45_003883 [Yamadazyma tenuis]